VQLDGFMRAKKKPLRKPFVVSLTALAATAIACGGSVGSESTSGGSPNPGTPNPPTNPPGVPGPTLTCPSTNVNDACQTEGDTCTGGCGSNCHCFCGRWLGDNMSGSCNPPAPACPTTEPTAGTTCNIPSTMNCNYDHPTSPCPGPTYTCDATKRTWTASIATCNPPPPDAGTD